MVAMINNHPLACRSREYISRFLKQLEDLENGSIYAPLSSGAKTKTGLSPSSVVDDERGQSVDRELYTRRRPITWGPLPTSETAHRRPMLIAIVP
jgi:hypothetical protein